MRQSGFRYWLTIDRKYLSLDDNGLVTQLVGRDNSEFVFTPDSVAERPHYNAVDANFNGTASISPDDGVESLSGAAMAKALTNWMHDGTTSGFTIFTVWHWDGNTAQTSRDLWSTSSPTSNVANAGIYYSVRTGTGDMRCNILAKNDTAPWEVTSAGTDVLTGTKWSAATHDNANLRTFTPDGSHGPVAKSATAFTTDDSTATVGIGTINTQMFGLPWTEMLFYDVEKTSAELDELATYFNGIRGNDI